jgi:hypothetical protein
MVTQMPILDNEKLRQMVCDDGLPGITYMLVWSQLDEESEGYEALSKALFDHDSVADPDEAPNRDLSDPTVRRGVFDCVMHHADVRRAFERVLAEGRKGQKPWWRFW